MSKVWDVLHGTGTWAAWLPVAWYDFIKNYPGRAAVLWPVTVALAIWWF